MKILAIGNSFSQDATTFIEDIAESAGQHDILAVNLYIGGCPLIHHAENLKTNKSEYDYQRHGIGRGTTSIREALLSDAWDVVTMQQASGYSGLYDSYHPHIDEVYAAVRELCPSAAVWLHRTWAYEEESGHPHFEYYDHDRVKMDTAIEDVYQKISAELSLPIIPSGNIITELKKLPAFDIENGGISLYRDRFHMSFTYGRYAAAAVWLRKLCGFDLSKATFVPEGAEASLIQIINDTVMNIVKKD